MQNIPPCFSCRRFWERYRMGPLQRYVCDAYPTGILNEILLGPENKHEKAMPGDHGMQYEFGTPHQGEVPPWVKN